MFARASEFDKIQKDSKVSRTWCFARSASDEFVTDKDLFFF